MSRQNQAIAHSLIDEVWNGRRLEVVDELLAPTFTNHDPNTPDLGTGPEAYKNLVNLYTTAFPDLRFSIEEIISDEETVVTRWRSSGTHKGELQGIPPTNQTITLEGITINHIENGKILDQHVSWDALGMMRQLGVAPTAGEARGRAA
jgi:steroid delta-isomerase-like uncharacterized protein